MSDSMKGNSMNCLIMTDFMRERNRKLHEMRLLLAGYMQNEDAARAKAVFEKWLKAVKEVGNEPADC